MPRAKRNAVLETEDTDLETETETETESETETEDSESESETEDSDLETESDGELYVFTDQCGVEHDAVLENGVLTFDGGQAIARLGRGAMTYRPK